MRDSDTLGFELHRFSNVLLRYADLLLQKRFGFGYSHFKIMVALHARPDCMQASVAHFLGQTEASVSRQLKLMVKQGLAESRQNPTNRREHVIHLSTKGEQLLTEAQGYLESEHAPVFGKLTEHEQQVFMELAAKVRMGLMDRLTTMKSDN